MQAMPASSANQMRVRFPDGEAQAMIRVAFLVHSLQAGGIERSITRIVNGLDTTKFEPTIICLDRSGPAANWLTRAVPIVEIGKRPGTDPLAIGRLAHVLRERRIDLVQSHNWGTLIECVLARKLAGTRFHVHAERGTVLGMVNPQGLRHTLRAAAMKRALRTVDRVISNAEAVAQRVQARCGYPAQFITIIPNGVPKTTDELREADRDAIRRRLGVAEHEIVIGSVGRLAPVKGFDLALRAFEKLQQRHSPVHFLLVGDGPEADALTELTSALGLAGKVHLVGRQERAEVWLSAMDIYVNSSHSEGMSQSIIEAMAAGLPIVATDVGDSAVLITKAELPCGVICPPSEVDSLAECFDRLVSDMSARRELAQNAIRCHASFYSEEVLIASIQTLYDEVLSRAKRTGQAPHPVGPQRMTT